MTAPYDNVTFTLSTNVWSGRLPIFTPSQNSAIFMTWETLRQAIIKGLIPQGYTSDRPGLTKAISDGMLNYIMCGQNKYSTNCILPGPSTVFNVPSAGNALSRFTMYGNTAQNEGYGECDDLDTSNLAVGISYGTGDYQFYIDNTTGVPTVADFGSSGGLIIDGSDLTSIAAIGLFFYAGSTGTFPPQTFRWSDSAIVEYASNLNGSGNLSFFNDQTKLLDWVFPQTPSKGTAVFSMNYPPINPASTDILIPQHTVPPLKRRIPFQNYTQSIPRMIKK